MALDCNNLYQVAGDSCAWYELPCNSRLTDIRSAAQVLRGKEETAVLA